MGDIADFYIDGYTSGRSYCGSCKQSNKKEDSKMEEQIERIENCGLKVVGVTFANEDGSSRRFIITEMLKKNDEVSLEREPDNKYDANAIKVVSASGQIGYIGKDYAAIIADMMDGGRKFSAIVDDCGLSKGRPYASIIVNEVY